MKNAKRWPEIYVDVKFLQREDIINKVVRVDKTTYNINFEHPVLGQTVEVYDLIYEHKLLCVRSVYPIELQNADGIETCKDYYNNFLLDGEETYLEYYNEEVGYFLLSRNITEVPLEW